MFDKKEVEAYQNISAPDDLRERVLSACEAVQPRKRSLAEAVRMLSALAACFVLVAVFSVFAIGNFGTFSVSVDGKTLTENRITLAANECDVAPLAMRMLSGKEVPLLFTLSEETEFSVSGGTMRMFDPETNALLASGSTLVAENDVMIRWTVLAEADETNRENVSFEMMVCSGKKSYTVVLAFDEDAQVWTVLRKNKD